MSRENWDGTLPADDLLTGLTVAGSLTSGIITVKQHGYEIGRLVQVREGRRAGQWTVTVEGKAQCEPGYRRQSTLAFLDLLNACQDMRVKEAEKRAAQTRL